MKVLLVDMDSKIPNLALMKISAHHKAQGDDVGFAIENPDKVYIFGVQPKTMSAGTELSSELKCAIPRVILSLKREINRIYDEKG